MSCAVATAHPRTLLGAAWAMLQPSADAQGQHLQAHAACLLGDHQRARGLWETLARGGDDEARRQLDRLAEWHALNGPRYPR